MQSRRTLYRTVTAESDPVSVTVEPRDGHSDEEVIEKLRDVGAEGIRKITRGFVSARTTRNTLHALSAIARVHIDTPAQPA